MLKLSRLDQFAKIPSIQRIAFAIFVVASLDLQFQQIACGQDVSSLPQQSVQGTASFADGEPLIDTELEFKVTRLGESTEEKAPGSAIDTIQSETDRQGSFQLTLPDTGDYSATVVATKWKDGDRRRWRCSIPKLSVNGRPLDLEFENRGRIVLRFFGTSNLSPDSEILLSCLTPGSDDQVNLHRTVVADSRGIVIDGLEPREYTVEAHVPKMAGRSWKQTVKVPEYNPFRALAKIQFPEFEYGTLKGRVVLPDGKTPAAGIRFWVVGVDEYSTFGGKAIFTDSDGMFAERRLIGNVNLEYAADPRTQGSAGHAPASFTATVKRNSITDMGTLKLQNADEVFAWINGTIKYSDGQPVENLVIGQNIRGLGDLLTSDETESLPMDLSKEQVGQFRMRVRAGKRLVRIGLDGSGRIQGGLIPKHTTDKYVWLSLELSPGDKIQRDIVIPRQSEPRNLKVIVGGGEAAAVCLFVVISPNFVWTASGYINEGSSTFENLPPGECLVIVRHDTENYFASRTLAANTFEHDIDFSRKEVGNLRIVFEDVESMNRNDFSLQLSIASPLQPIPVVNLGAFEIGALGDPPQAGAESLRSGDSLPRTKHPNIERDEDASLTVKGLAPGKYQLQITDRMKKREFECTILSDQTTTVNF